MRYDPIRTITRRSSANPGICSTPICGKPRHGVSERCRLCMTAHRVHGHARGKHVPNCAYARELAQAQRHLIDKEDEQTRAILRQIAKWLAEARGEVARLAKHRIAPARILAEWIALYTYARRNPRELPDDGRLNFALANKTLRLAPRKLLRTLRPPSMAHPKRVYGMASRAERADLGATIRFRFVVYLASVATALDRTPKRSTNHKDTA